MLKENADKEYLALKVQGYREQGDNEMVDKFMDAYINRVGSTHKEIEELIKKGRKQSKSKKQKGSDE